MESNGIRTGLFWLCKVKQPLVRLHEKLNQNSSDDFLSTSKNCISFDMMDLKLIIDWYGYLLDLSFNIFDKINEIFRLLTV